MNSLLLVHPEIWSQCPDGYSTPLLRISWSESLEVCKGGVSRQGLKVSAVTSAPLELVKTSLEVLCLLPHFAMNLKLL